MESNRRRRRRRDNKPKAPKPKTVESSPIGGATSTTVHDVPDHVLEVILLCLNSHVSLIRAASTCKRWCRVVADDGFLCRFHPLPSPLILGHYYHANNEQLVFVPSSTRSIRERSRQSFSLDFVPKLDGAWEIADSRDTLLLLSKSEEDWMTRSSSVNNPDLVVCRPLTRRYKAISVPEPDRLAGRQCLGLFLVEGGGGGVGSTGRSIGLSNFRVIAVLLRDHMLVRGRGVPVACVYEGRCGWRDVSCTWSCDINIPNTAGSFYFAGRANGSLYWAIQGARAALVLDEATTRVSRVDLPVAIIHPWYPRSSCFRVIPGEDDGAVSLRAVHLMVNDLRVYARLRVGDEWVLQNLLPLPVLENVQGAPWNAMIVAAHETYVLVRPRDSARLFSVDLKTMAVEFVRQGIMDGEGAAYPFELPWPPTLDLEAAPDNSNPNTTVQGHIESTWGFQIPYTELKATQNIARLSFRSICHGTCVIVYILAVLVLCPVILNLAY